MRYQRVIIKNLLSHLYLLLQKNENLGFFSLFQIYCRADALCLPFAKKCDGVIDCSDGFDEIDCPNPINNTAKENSDSISCGLHQFRCHRYSECIRVSSVCDGYQNCLDGSDESDCPGNGFFIFYFELFENVQMTFYAYITTF